MSIAFSIIGTGSPNHTICGRICEPSSHKSPKLISVPTKSYNLDDEEERKKYFEDLRANQKEITLADGGEVEGPGTGTSDSVPAMLSDGEFVLTAKAVRGAGGGDRDIGAARMYDMMSELERVA